MYVGGYPYGLWPWVIRVLSSLALIRLQLALRCEAMGQSYAELYDMFTCTVTVTVCPAVGYSCGKFYSLCTCALALRCATVGYSYAEHYSVYTCAVIHTVCDRG